MAKEDNRIKCSVDNCTFWKNNICTANAIEVAKNFGDGIDMEAAALGQNSGSSSQTKCITFKPANK